MTGNEKRIMVLVHDDFEDLELWYPVLRLREEGYIVSLVGEQENKLYKGKYGLPANADLGYDDVNPVAFDGLMIPGGWAPDKLRRIEQVLNLVRHFDETNKPIGQICHAGWVLISAGILKGRTVTSTIAIKDDLANAGASWVDQAVVVDNNLVSSRRPPDLPEYTKEFIQVLKKLRVEQE